MAEAAGNISFYLENLEREEKRKEAELNAKKTDAHLSVSTLIDRE